ncbi:MAG: hypothetical protein RQ842_08145 [Vulcanisaeta sp.]|nr:hypothetical protein [Vulcanisaeta sp.]
MPRVCTVPSDGILKASGDETVEYVVHDVVLVLRRFNPEVVVRGWAYDWVVDGVGYIIGKTLYKALVDGGLGLKPITYDTWELQTRDGVLNIVKRVVQLLDGIYRITIERGEASIGLVIDNVKTVLLIKPISGGYVMRSYVDKLEVGGTPLYNDIANRVAEAVKRLSREGRGFFTTWVGDCEVVLNNASRMAFTITPSLLGIDLPFAIPIHETNAFVVTSESSIIIRHADYGEKTFKFDREYLLWVRARE